MLDVLQTKLSIANLNSRIQTWAKAVGVTLPQALLKQGGALKVELMRGAPPRDLSRSKKQATKDVKKSFFPKPTETFKGAKAQGKGMIWLYAGKNGGRFLAGVHPEDFIPNASDEAMRAIHAESKKQFRGAAWHRLGERGKDNPFKVFRINRTVVNRGRLRAFTRLVQNSFGKLKASWVVDLGLFRNNANVPQWIAKHIQSGEAKGATVMNLNSDKPFVRIISRANGVEHSRSRENVRRAVKRRAGAMLADIRLHLQGIKKKVGFKAA